MSIPPLVAELRAQTGQFTAEMTKAKAELRSVETASNSSGGKIKDAITKHFTAAGESSKGLTSQLSGLSPAMMGVAAGAGVAGAAVLKFAVDGVTAFVDLAGEVRNFSRATGMGAEDSSRMVAILDDLGISSETGAASLFKLAKNVADGGANLAQYGIQVAQAKDGTTDLKGTLLNVADAYSSQSDQAKRAELVTAAFGKQGKDLIPILEKGRAGIEEMFGAVKRGEILSQKQLDDARKFELAIDDTQDSLRSLQIQGGMALLPYITTMSEATTATLDFIDRNAQRAGGVQGILSSFVAGFNPVLGLVNLFSKGNKEAGEEDEVAKAKFVAQTAALEGMGVEVSDAEKRTGELTEETKKAAAEAEKYRARIDQMGTSVASAYTTMSGKSVELSDKQRDLARSFDTSKTSADNLKAGLDILVGVHISATRAGIDWEAQLATTRAALAENKATLDISTEAGRENSTTLLDMIQKGNAHVEALQREGASSETVTAAYQDHVGALRNVMHQAGFTDAQIEELLRKYNLLAAAPDIDKHIGVHTTYTSSGAPYTVGSGENAYDARGDNYDLGGVVRGPYKGAAVRATIHAGEGVLTVEQMDEINRASTYGSGTGWPGGGGAVVNNYHVEVYTSTGDIPDSTLRKIQEGFFRMTLDSPAGSILPS